MDTIWYYIYKITSKIKYNFVSNTIHEQLIESNSIAM